MKCLLIAHYAGFDMDDPEEFRNNAWTVGTCNSKEEIIKYVDMEFTDYVDEQLSNRFDRDYEDLSDEDKEKYDYFKKDFSIKVFKKFKLKLNEPVLVGKLHYDNGFNYEDEKVEAILLEE